MSFIFMMNLIAFMYGSNGEGSRGDRGYALAVTTIAVAIFIAHNDLDFHWLYAYAPAIIVFDRELFLKDIIRATLAVSFYYGMRWLLT